MKKSIISIIFIGLCLSPQVLGMQPVEQKNVHQILQKNFTRFKEIIACAWNKEGCSREELNNARIGLSVIIASLLLIMGSGIGLVTKTPWWHAWRQQKKERWRQRGLEQLIIAPGQQAEYEEKPFFY